MKRLSFLISMPFMGVLLVVLIVVLALGTFIESSYNTATAWGAVYGTKWFELLLLLIAVNIAGVMIRYKFYRRKKLIVFIFHLSFLVILAGAAITRYISYEGMMHIREQEMSDTMLSNNAYIQVRLEAGGDTVQKEKEVRITVLSPRDYRMSTKIAGEKVRIRSTGYMSNAMEQYVASASGKPYLQLVMVAGQQTSAGLPSGTSRNIMGMGVSFNKKDTTAVLRFESEGDQVLVSAPFAISTGMMGTETQVDHEPGERIPFEEGTLYRFGHMQVALQQYLPSAVRKLVQGPVSGTGMHMGAVRLEIRYRGMTSQIYVPGLARAEGKPVTGEMGDLRYAVTYGSRVIRLPFSLYLKDFQVERYPGSHSPSSFASEVVLVDKDMNIREDRRIYMNNVLKHRGFRFYQSSYDTDEMGTILSVNKDLAGTTVTYVGYFILFAGMILSLFAKGTRFAAIARNTGSRSKAAVALLLFIGLSVQGFSQMVPPKDVSADFGKLWVQDKGGRYEPMNTLSHEVVRKITKKSKFGDYTADQVMLGMMLYPNQWQALPLFKVKNPELRRILGNSGETVSFNQFMDESGTRYLLSDLVNQAYSKEVAARTDLDKEVIKLDDRINAMYLVQSGELAVIFPDSGSENHKWISVSEELTDRSRESTDSIGTVFLRYLNNVRNGNYAEAGIRLAHLLTYQEKNEPLLPGDEKKNMEIRYNRIGIFPLLGKFYGLFGVLMMVLQFMLVFRSRNWVRICFRIGVGLFGVAFLVHMAALAVRWYLSGHAPTSNGYESMIFVSWVTILAGLIFVRRSGYVMGLTGILAFLALMVAGMSNMNPEITNLVPVLKSPWLTIHVTVVMAGYGFLGLASIMGLLNLVLYASLTSSNRERIGEVISNVTRVNHLTLIVGLYFMTIGMFMGGIWANESWGRYWGWDPKETWALITVLVYAFVTHMHKIPGLRGVFAFNLASLIGYSSVLMTYFGVNYFLGGIHSYAQGTAFKIPVGIYVAIGVLVALGVFAYDRQKKWMPGSLEADDGLMGTADQ